MRKRLFFQLVLGAALAFVGAEFALRLFGFTHLNNNTLDKNNLIIFKPTSAFINKGVCFAPQVTTNSLGFHSKEYSLQKPVNTYRIVVLGDSFVEAVQVPLEETFFSRLEEKLNASSTSTLRYEIIPIAKSGHGTLANLLFAREYALQFKPDLIIDAFTSNDLTDDLADKDVLHAKPEGDHYDPASLYVQGETPKKRQLLLLKHTILEHSMLLERWWKNMLVVKAGLSGAAADKEAKEEGSSNTLFEALLNPDGETAKKLFDSEERALASLKVLVKDNHAKLLLLQLSERFMYDPHARTSWTNDDRLLNQFAPMGLKNKLSERAKNQSIPFFSTEDYFLNQYRATGLTPNLSCDNHYSSLGHEWVAEALYGFLERNPVLIVPDLQVK